jgi:hypothetical protein
MAANIPINTDKNVYVKASKFSTLYFSIIDLIILLDISIETQRLLTFRFFFGFTSHRHSIGHMATLCFTG